MKSAIALAVLVLVVATTTRADEDFYDSKYDEYDLDAIISNKRLLENYINCFLGKGKCTPDGAKFKKILPEALESTCGRCTPKQGILVRKGIRAIQEQLPESWAQLVKTYDPEGKYRNSFEKFLANTD
uniref:Chemosensory protein 9 n=1 Tax=Streltzoviella insularis TaxID=1206366 RepID=A0A7D5UML2_9NEOP|nr:chemosensory protein 9 [Streltzoviella insularis]